MEIEDRHPLSSEMRERVLEELERAVPVLPRTQQGSQLLDRYLRNTVRHYA